MIDKKDHVNNIRVTKSEQEEGCVLFSYKMHETNNQVTYTLYKQVSRIDANSKIITKKFEFKKEAFSVHNITNQGKLFIDKNATLQYPDTIEILYDPIKNVLTHLLLYKEGKLIFNIPYPEDPSDLKFYPTNVLENVTKGIVHNGSYPVIIYPNLKKDVASFYYTWQHKTYLSIKYLCRLLIVLYIFKKIKPHLPF